MKTVFLFLVLLIMLCSCKSNISIGSVDTWKDEIIEAERRFAEMAASDGIPAAFAFFAAEDVVINRNDSLYIGKEALKKFYFQPVKSRNVQLTWKPDYVDVSQSGDLGYTYGKFRYTATDSAGNSRSVDGIFHTVWKRQDDGTWKFVWD